MFSRSIILKKINKMLTFSNYKLLSNKNYESTELLYSEQVMNLTLINSKKCNILNTKTIGQLQLRMKEIDNFIKNEKARILVLRSTGNVFSSGHDLKQLVNQESDTVFDRSSIVLNLIRNLSVPTLCVANGIVAAAGFQLALCCDIIIASQKTKFSTPGVKWGLFCSTPAVELIRASISKKKAYEMLLFGQDITAHEAMSNGLVNAILPEQQIQKQVVKYVNKTKKLSAQVLTLGKNVLQQQQSLQYQEAYKLAIKGMKNNLKLNDCQEGIKAFKEKRKPQFKH